MGSVFTKDFLDWIDEDGFYVKDTWNPKENKWGGKGNVYLFPFQRRILKHVLTLKEDGTFPYTTVLFSTVKKAGKTSLSACVTSWFAECAPEGTEVYICANSKEQAEGRVMKDVKYHFAHALRDDTPKVNQWDIKFRSGTFIQALSQSFSANAGSRHALVTFDELWGAVGEGDRRMWDEMTPIPTIPYSLRFITTYAGFMNESDLLWELYLQGVGTTEHPDGKGTPVPELADITDSMGNPICWSNGGLFTYWNHEPTMPWQTDDYYCLPLPKEKNDLMALTKDGWKCAEDITVSDELCTRNAEGNIEYQHPLSIFQDNYVGDLVHLDHTKCHLVMTPNHRVYAAYANHCRKVKDTLRNPFVYEYREAKDAAHAQVGWIPGHGNLSNLDLEYVRIGDVDYPADDFIQLLAWYLSEGCIRYRYHAAGDRYPDCFTVAQSRDRNFEKYQVIEDIFVRLGIKYRKNRAGISSSDWNLKRYFSQFGKSHEKKIPRWLLDSASSRQLRLFVDTYMLGDGTRLSPNHYMLYTNSDQMRLDLLEATFKAGYRPRYTNSYSSSPETGRKEIHHISVMESHIGWVSTGKRNNWSSQPAPDNTVVWCPTLPNGNFYVYQNGCCFWTGNSQQAVSLRPSAYLRLHENRWVTTHEAYIPIEWWDRAVNPDWKQADLWAEHPFRWSQIFVGVDASSKRDSTAVVGVGYDAKRGEVGLAFHKIWIPREQELFDHETTVEKYIREKKAQGFRIAEIVYDPAHFVQTANRLRVSGFKMTEYTQSVTNMTIASQKLYDLMKSKAIRVYPSDELRTHILNCVAQEETRGFRIVKQKDAGRVWKPIDAAIALAMACYRAVESGGVDFSTPTIIQSPFSDVTAWKHNTGQQFGWPFDP